MEHVLLWLVLRLVFAPTSPLSVEFGHKIAVDLGVWVIAGWRGVCLGSGWCWSGVCRWGGVLIEDVVDRDWLIAVWAEPAEIDADAGAVAVVAPLLAQVAGIAFGALVDGDVASGGAGRDGDGRCGGRVGVAGAPGGLAAGG